MKPLTINFVCVVLVVGFSSVSAALCQSNPPQACEVHESSVSKLTNQAESISERLAYDASDEAEARTALSDFNRALADPRLRQSVLEKYFGAAAGKNGENKVMLLRGMRDEQVRRVERIDYARKHHAELQQQRANVERQLAYHHNRMTELGCKAARQEEPPKIGCDGFAGTWKTGFGEMTFTITDNTATASYSFDNGTVRGTLTTGGRVLVGTYSEGQAKGTFQFVLADDGQSFSGRWRRTSGKREPPAGTWDGKCIQR